MKPSIKFRAVECAALIKLQQVGKKWILVTVQSRIQTQTAKFTRPNKTNYNARTQEQFLAMKLLEQQDASALFKTSKRAELLPVPYKLFYRERSTMCKSKLFFQTSYAILLHYHLTLKPMRIQGHVIPLEKLILQTNGSTKEIEAAS